MKSFGRMKIGEYREMLLKNGLNELARDITGQRNFARRKIRFDKQTEAQRRINRQRIVDEKNGQSQSQSKA